MVIGVKKKNKAGKWTRKFREPEDYDLNITVRGGLTEVTFEKDLKEVKELAM